MAWRDTVSIPQIVLTYLDNDSEDFWKSWHLSTRLAELNMYVEQFEHAVLLLDFLEERERAVLAQNPGPLPGPDNMSQWGQWREEKDKYVSALMLNSGWKYIAARDAAMTVFHFGKVFVSIRSEIRKTPALQELVDGPVWEQADQLLKTYFGKRKQLRHAVAHAGEMASDPAAAKRNSVDGPVNLGPLKIGKDAKDTKYTHLQARTFSVSREREGLSLEITPQTLSRLKEIRGLAFSAFKRAEEVIRQRSFEAWKEQVAQARPPSGRTPHQP